VLKIFKLLIGLEVNGSLVRNAWGVAPVLGVYQGMFGPFVIVLLC